MNKPERIRWTFSDVPPTSDYLDIPLWTDIRGVVEWFERRHLEMPTDYQRQGLRPTLEEVSQSAVAGVHCYNLDPMVPEVRDAVRYLLNTNRRTLIYRYHH